MLTVKITNSDISTTTRHRTSSIVAAIGRAVRKRYGTGRFFYWQTRESALSYAGVVGRPDGFGGVTPIVESVMVEVD